MVKLKTFQAQIKRKNKNDFLQFEKEKKILADFQSKCKLGKADIDQTEP